MRNFSYFVNEATFPVIGFRQRARYIDGQKSDLTDSCFTILHNYEQINIVVQDNGKTVNQEQIKAAADNGTPLEMVFYDLEITIRGKSAWEIQASGRASRAEFVSKK